MSGRAMARLLACLLVGLACLPVRSRSTAPAVNPELVVRKFAEGFGSGTGRLTRLFLNDAEVRLAGLGVGFRGRREIERLLDYARAAEARLELSALERRGDTVFCRLAEDNAWLRALGADSLRYSARFLFQGGRVAEAEIRLLPGSRAALGRSGMAFALWVRDHAPGAIERILPGGRPEFSRDSVRQLLELIRRWQTER